MSYSFIDKQTNRTIFFYIGLSFLFLFSVFFLFSGSEIFVIYHDNLDLLTNAFAFSEAFFSNNWGEVESLLNGLQLSYIQPDSILLSSLYYFFSPLMGYIFIHLFTLIIAYLSMYYLLKCTHISALFSAIASFLFAILPFYTGYGFTMMCVPLYCISMQGVCSAKSKKSIALYLSLAVVYGACSSLVLGGYVVLLFSGLFFLWSCYLKKTWQYLWRIVLTTSTLVITYLLSNSFLLYCLFFTPNEASHREVRPLEIVSYTLKDVLTFWFSGQYHAVSNHNYILCFILAVLGVSAFMFFSKKSSLEPLLCYFNFLIILVIFSLFCAFFYYAWYSPFFVALKSILPDSAQSANLSRFYFFYPFTFYSAFAVSLELLWRLIGQTKKELCRCGFTIVFAVCVLLTCSITAFKSAKSNTLFLTPLHSIAPEFSEKHGTTYTTWSDFYAEDIFTLIKEDINLPVEDYRVASLGLYPSVATYNGFYVLDGYFTLYPLSYKNEFYPIIADELALDDVLYDYFVNWGSRCYLFSHELGRSYHFSKTSDITINDLRLNLEAFAELGGRYIFSAVKIENCTQYRLQEFGYYETTESYYGIYVYEYLS